MRKSRFSEEQIIGVLVQFLSRPDRYRFSRFR